jgi:hypothetical protein
MVKPIALATTAFKVLLDGIQPMSTGQPSVLHCCPQATYAVFTVAISLITTIRHLRMTADVNPTSSSSILTARVSLLSCTEALGELARTWPLAGRCHGILQRLTEEEQLQRLHISHMGQFTPASESYHPAVTNVLQPLNMAGPSHPNPDFSRQSLPRTMANNTQTDDAALELLCRTAEWTSDDDLYAMLNFDCPV